MPLRPTLLAEFLSEIIKNFSVLSSPQNSDYFRIVDIKKNKQNECLFEIQVIGKATLFECTPQEIAANDKFIEGFSKKDIRTITYFATEEIKKPRYKILVQEIQEGTHKMLFKIGRRGVANPIEKTADQISLDKELLNQLTQEDAHRVGHVTAMENFAKEKEEMTALKKY